MKIEKVKVWDMASWTKRNIKLKKIKVKQSGSGFIGRCQTG
jgi:hypothetical protein